MLNLSDANRLASEHIASLEPPCDGYVYQLGEMRRVESGWFFGYSIHCELDIPENDQEKFAGAVGFVISQDSGSVTPISHPQWVDLGLAFCDDPYGEVE